MSQRYLSRDTLIRVATSNCYVAHNIHQNPELREGLCAGLMTKSNMLCEGCKACELFHGNHDKEVKSDNTDYGYNPYQE